MLFWLLVEIVGWLLYGFDSWQEKRGLASERAQNERAKEFFQK